MDKSVAYRAITDQEFEQVLTLRDSYRIMERFLSDYLARGDAPVSEFLHAYAGETIGGQTTDPAALSDYLASARSVLC
ncbi:hypothetical protein Q3C01_12205 [Bradyrhizobium sp. UFLA05-109]